MFTTFVSAYFQFGGTFRFATIVHDEAGYAFRLADGTVLRQQPTLAITQDHLLSLLRAADYNGSVTTIPADAVIGEHAWKKTSTVQEMILADRWANSRGYSKAKAQAIAAGIALLKSRKVRKAA